MPEMETVEHADGDSGRGTDKRVDVLKNFHTYKSRENWSKKLYGGSGIKLEIKEERGVGRLFFDNGGILLFL